jgi:hypothetical protein
MSWEREPEFLDREVVDAIHQHQVDTYGGLHGVRDENALAILGSWKRAPNEV